MQGVNYKLLQNRKVKPLNCINCCFDSSVSVQPVPGLLTDSGAIIILWRHFCHKQHLQARQLEKRAFFKAFNHEDSSISFAKHVENNLAIDKLF